MRSRSRVTEAEDLDAKARDFLLMRTAEIEGKLASVPWVLSRGPIHGDPFLGNVINGPDGPVLCDFDGFSHGPREWDLTPIAVSKLRFSYPTDDHTPLAREYGFNILDWPGFPILREVRELILVTSVLPVLRSQPSLRAQWRHRFDSFVRSDTEVRWQPYR